MRAQTHLEALAVQAIRKTLDVEAPALLRATTDAKHGDYQINGAMALAKPLGRSPRDLAAAIAEAVKEYPEVARAEVAGPGFVNLTLDDAWIARSLEAMLADDRDGVERVVAPERMVVDFSSPNIAKQMHVGHLRSTIIGAAIVRLLRFVGHDVIADNHLGDWGTQFGLLILGMREYGSEEALGREPIVELERVYKLASARSESEPTFAELARHELAKLQAGDPDNRAMWERFVAATRVELDAIYGRLGIEFDEWLGESAYHDMLPGVVDLLLEKGIAREDQGAICVFFGELDRAPETVKGLDYPFIVRKRDGAYLYATTDVATVLHRRDQLGAQRSIYVVDSRQSPHFRQLFAVVELLGIDMKLEHVTFGTVMGTDGKPLRTRDASGNVITLASLLDESIERARARIREEEAADNLRIPDGMIDEVARAVGIGAVKYADLSQNRTSDYQFDWDKMISFKGNAGPYLQNQYVRVRSIFRKGNIDLATVQGPIALDTPEEQALGRQLLRLSDQIHVAAETYQPHLVSEHLYAVSRAFASFYALRKVLEAETDRTRNSRLALSALTARQLHRGLTLLGIDVVEHM
jgi:arginyl-tRNA synthetase